MFVYGNITLQDRLAPLSARMSSRWHIANLLSLLTS